MKERLFIVDTNVLVAGLITGDPASPTAMVLDAMIDGRLFYLLSADLLLEYRSVLMRRRISRLHGLKEPEIDQLLTEISANAIWRDPSPNREYLSPDANDDHLWELMGSEPSAVLITGDRLLIENPRPQSSVIDPATWAHLKS